MITPGEKNKTRVNLDFLAQVDLFANLSKEELERISASFEERVYRNNEVVFSEADTGRYMYIVKEGCLKVARRLPNGRELLLAFHQRGEYFGEMSLIDGKLVPATVTALLPTTILCLTRQEFLSLLDDPTINRALLRTLCRRCREAWRQMKVLTSRNAGSRVRMTLYDLSLKKGLKTDQGIVITLYLTHKKLADLAGISRETASRVLSHLQAENLVQVRNHHFLIPDPGELLAGAQQH